MTEKKGMRQRLRNAGWGAIVLLFAAGIVFWGGFNWALEMTNTEKFCISCHEMEDNVFQEYRNTIHYQNRTGVRATCPDCHVPKEWGPKMIRKIKASREVYGKIMGTINTREKFQEERLRLAENEWRRMKANNSQECRNCHNYEYFDYSVQGRRSNQMHQAGLAEGKTCIDCHKGIAHSLPAVDQSIGADHGGVAPEVFHPTPPKAE
ncbi:cytochrome c-type protein NapC [Parazoarcus communis]|uniref:Cytochrome c-type protein n=1 Tax=Parazoarcus communis TaxID=41977 RepID=A0A2U8GSQ0_9RHOO|nr:NapC/NirT family cytochrome c [Parazoarcus communis]AWI76498.1 cytochrome c-type protein NapC [Parazoarcus communis]|tara:strand:- start:45996 stop:46616 length:621 start_codon:yes stop_codon:yes gene_type:complete